MRTRSRSLITIERTQADRPKVPIHPGEILLEEFLKPGGVSQVAFARRLGITPAALNDIIKGKRGLSARTAWLLSMALGTSPELWAGLQSDYDLAKQRPARKIARLKLVDETSSAFER